MARSSLTPEEARGQVARKGVDLLAEGLVQRTSGNVSVRIDDRRIAISPSGVPYRDIESVDVPIVDLDGDQVGEGEAPSSETPMHTAVYRRRAAVGAVVHTHSPYATTFASLGRPIEPTHYLIAVAGKAVPVAPYARNGTAALADAAVETMGEANAVLLRNHGVLAVGSTLEAAHDVAARVEYCGRIHWQASVLGEPERIDDAELDALIEYFEEYG